MCRCCVALPLTAKQTELHALAVENGGIDASRAYDRLHNTALRTLNVRKTWTFFKPRPDPRMPSR